MSATLASAAFRLAFRRLHVFPLRPGTKIPLPKSHGLHDATADLDVTRDRWRRHPGANVAVATGPKSGVWIQDVDRQHGGLESLAALEAKHGALPLTVQAATPNGGFHYWWRWPEAGPEIRNSTSRVAPGIDIRGVGGGVVAPPSVLSDGRRYLWVKNGAKGFAEAPAWLVALALPPPRPPHPEPKPLNGDLTRSRYVAAAIGDELRQLERAAPGSRNETLNRCAFNLGQFVGAGVLPQDWAVASLETRALALGLPQRETRSTIASGLGAGALHPRELP